MIKQEVIAILDVGKTNKKLLLFNRKYEVVYEWTDQLPESSDEDGFPCENLPLLERSVHDLIQKAVSDDRFVICALNFATYGASIVYIAENGSPLTPLYNYLKPFPEVLQLRFYQTYGKAEEIARETASPALGNLNSGLQVWSVKQAKPHIWEQTKYALHLPQYIGFLFHKKGYTDITSIGCHTQLWSFDKRQYHQWVIEEKLDQKFGELKPYHHVEIISLGGKQVPCGIGLHDSSSSLIPYLQAFSDPFLLISTGTWSISMNPFDHTPLTREELDQDCLCYFQFNGQPVKASRLFMGRIHDEALAKLGSHFPISVAVLAEMEYATHIHDLAVDYIHEHEIHSIDEIDFSTLASAELAYFILMVLLVKAQLEKLALILIHKPVEQIYVDGGFSKNKIFMTILAKSFPDKKVFASEVAQATALGAALALHEIWNKESEYQTLISLRAYN